MMDMNAIINQLDALYTEGKMQEAEAFMEEQLDMAMASGQDGVALGILNEQLGFYRVMTQHEKALQTISRVKNLLEKMGLSGTIEEGTTLLNVATVYRAMGKYGEAEACYLTVEDIYKQKLDGADYRMAGLYNNMSLLQQEQGKEELAATYLKKALSIIEQIPGSEIQTAVTYTNLGQAYCRMGKWELAKTQLDAAEKIFTEVDVNDEHYAGLASALGYWYLEQEDYERSICYYEKALLNVYQCYGITENFKNIQKDLKVAYRRSGEPEYKSMLEVCRAYYEKYGKPMIHEQFGEYEDQIAVGLCGEGSECFGMEDEISLDHDCGPGFALWVTDSVSAEIGEALQEAYDELPKVFAGYIRVDTAQGNGRCGVCRIGDFYKRVLGGKDIPESEQEWNEIEESALATAVNGQIFTDPVGIFTEKRAQLLQYYPDFVWLEKLARELIYAAQTGQYNYGRAMARGDYVTASIALSEYMKSIMHVVFLLNKKYAPYYKWQHAMVKKLAVLPEVGDILEAVCDMPSQREAWKDYKYNGNPNPKDMIAQTIEIVAKLIVHTLQEMGLSGSPDPYLEVQGQEVIRHMYSRAETATEPDSIAETAAEPDGRAEVRIENRAGEETRMENRTIEETEMNQEPTREQLIDEIVRFEWMEFDLVKNEGGRAGCQNDWSTFSIMRKSQYMTWTDDMLHEYLWHLNDSWKKGRNLITEKYGRMMESTAPERYAEIKDAFPALSEERIQIMETIIKIQVDWMEEFAKDYPKMAGNARLIHTYEDTPYETSYETYLRGELGTYSEELLNLYARFIVALSREHKNLAYMTMDNTAKLYGYENVEDAERRLL